MMKISLIQTSLVWEDPEANRQNFTDKIRSITGKTDLIVLPEMFATGFTMQPEPVAETMEGDSVRWMLDMAKEKDSAITGSLVITENGKYYNRMLFVTPEGIITQYDKRHLFTLAGEQHTYTPGQEKVIVNYRNWKICLQVCYDLRFPVFARNAEDYDVLLYPANWPQQRMLAWDALLKARAIENMCYTVGLNRIGHDDNGHHYSGHSQVVDYMGEYILRPQESEGVFTITLEKESMLLARQKLGFLNDRDNFILQKGQKFRSSPS